MRKFFAAGIAAAVVAFGFATLAPRVVSAHEIFSVAGTVNCQGDYSITATGDVYAGVHLVVTLDGNVIFDQAENGTSAQQTFGPFTGTGATAGESIAAYPSDTHNGASGVLVLSSDGCSTPTPTATPTPTPTPTATPTPTPTPTPVPVNVTVQTTCATASEQVGPNGTGTVTFNGLTVGDFLNLEDTGGVLITSDTFTQTGLAGPAVDTYAETDGDITVASGTFTISSCAVSTPTPKPTPPSAPPVPVTGAGI